MWGDLFRAVFEVIAVVAAMGVLGIVVMAILASLPNEDCISMSDDDLSDEANRRFLEADYETRSL